MKTIKQIADELGVSKTAVRKKIENLGLRSGLQKNGNQFAIDENQEKLIKSAFSESKVETKTETNSQTETETVSTLVSMLQRELDAKNEQIAHLQKLLDQEQQLRMVTEQKLLQIEDKQVQEEQPKKRWRFWK
jgi:predicted ArsR family transcriptional regulator